MAMMGKKMKSDDIEELLKVAAPADGMINIEEFCQALCPPKPKT